MFNSHLIINDLYLLVKGCVKILKFITFNIRHALGMDDRVDLERIHTIIAQLDANVVALQEVDRFMSRSGHVDQVAELARALQMDWRYAASLRHGRSEYGNAVLSKLRIAEDEVIFFPGERERRSLLKVKLDTPFGLIGVMTTHLGVTERDRIRQMPMLIAQLMKEEIPSILMGDFNMESNHDLMEGLCRFGWKEVKLDDTKYGTVIGGGTVDHIFVRELQNVSKAYSFATAASDHSVVIVEISQLVV
jgi:endonuclease/exonuclease/phosphatase family metal-dependent hydrolase